MTPNHWHVHLKVCAPQNGGGKVWHHPSSAEQEWGEIVEIVAPDIGLMPPVGEWGVDVLNAVLVKEGQRGLDVRNERIEGPY